jgi:hypothetical protein
VQDLLREAGVINSRSGAFKIASTYVCNNLIALIGVISHSLYCNYFL